MTVQDDDGHFAPGDRAFLSDDTPSINADRVQNTDAAIAAFGAISWPLAAIDAGHRPSRTIHFREWPEGFQNFARHVAYVLLNYGVPESLLEQHKSRAVRWPSSASVHLALDRLRRQVRWLTLEWTQAHPDTPITGPNDMDSQHLNDLKTWIELHHTSSRERSAHLLEIERVWHLNSWMPDDCQWPDPPWRHQGRRFKRIREENKSLPIHESTFGPLLEWAIAFVTSFAPDILSAQKHYLERLESRPLNAAAAGARAILDEYAASMTPLPPKPATAGGKPGNGVGWHVLAYRHAVPAQRFSDAFRGKRKASLSVSQDATLTALETSVLGQFQGQPWISSIGVYDVDFAGAGRKVTDHGGPLTAHLRTACLIVTAALTGMRPEEVLGLQHGCAREPVQRPGGSRLHLIQGRVFKGKGRLEDGSPREALPAVWATIPVTADAIRVAEQVNEVLGQNDGLLFSQGKSISVHTGTATGWIESFVEFVNTRLAPQTASPTAFKIPSDPEGAVTLKRFRRTLAWFLRHRPSGDVTIAIQYQHVGVAMGEGYAGTKASGMPDLLLEEDWNHRRKTVEDLSDLLSSGQGIGGPAAGHAVEATRRLPRQLLPADERRLRKDKSLLVYENPAAIALCFYDESKALCQKLKQAKRDARPDLLDCVPGCLNCARTDEHLMKLTRQSGALRDQAALVPLPMAQSMLAEAERKERIVSEFNSTRITLENSSPDSRGANLSPEH